MKVRGRRLVFSMAVALVLFGQFGAISVAQSADEAHLTKDATSLSPSNGESLVLDSIAGFDPTGGRATIEPDTQYSEEFDYEAIDAENLALTGIDRPNPSGHPGGSIVAPLISPSATPSQSPTPTGASPPNGLSSDETTSEGSPQGAQPDDPSPAGSNPNSNDDTDAVDSGPNACDMAEGASGKDICGAANISNPCDLNPLLCNIPPSPEIITAVAFDDIYGLPIGSTGCGLAGFTAYKNALQPATQHEEYLVTATTNATLSVPQTWRDNLDDSGRGVVYYCPPAGLFNPALEVTFTATVQGITGTAMRTWNLSPATSDPVNLIDFCRANPAQCTPVTGDSLEEAIQLVESGAVTGPDSESLDTSPDALDVPGVQAGSVDIADRFSWNYASPKETWYLCRYHTTDGSTDCEPIGHFKVGAHINLSGRGSGWGQWAERWDGPWHQPSNGWRCIDDNGSLPNSTCQDLTHRKADDFVSGRYTNPGIYRDQNPPPYWNKHNDDEVYWYKFHYHFDLQGYPGIEWRFPETGDLQSAKFTCLTEYEPQTCRF